MPILLISMVLALASASADRRITQSAAAPQAATPVVTPAAFTPDQPPQWWLDKMQRPCTKVGSRVSC